MNLSHIALTLSLLGTPAVYAGTPTHSHGTPAHSHGTPTSHHTSTLSERDMNRVLAAIRTVESNNDPSAVGDNGNAIGIYQIWRSYFRDAVEYGRLDLEYRDCFDPVHADTVVRSYMRRYATERRLGRPVTMEDIARIHNGGPNGYKKQATVKYWKKVKAILDAG